MILLISLFYFYLIYYEGMINRIIILLNFFMNNFISNGFDLFSVGLFRKYFCFFLFLSINTFNLLFYLDFTCLDLFKKGFQLFILLISLYFIGFLLVFLLFILVILSFLILYILLINFSIYFNLFK
jgi:hypothetical protein